VIWGKLGNGDYKSQSWDYTTSGRVTHKATGRALTTGKDRNLCLLPFNHQDKNQQWSLIPLSSSV
jgi:hypothetical protein